MKRHLQDYVRIIRRARQQCFVDYPSSIVHLYPVIEGSTTSDFKIETLVRSRNFVATIQKKPLKHIGASLYWIGMGQNERTVIVQTVLGRQLS